MNTLDNHRRSALAAATSKALHAGSAVTLTALGLLAAPVPAQATPTFPLAPATCDSFTLNSNTLTVDVANGGTVFVPWSGRGPSLADAKISDSANLTRAHRKYREIPDFSPAPLGHSIEFSAPRPPSTRQRSATPSANDDRQGSTS